MSKKHKIKKKVAVPERSSEIKSIPAVPPKLQKSTGKDFSLILFDRKTKLFLLVLVATYIVISSLKIHTSSVGMWGNIFKTEDTASILAGTPRPIRQDEWMLNTPAILGQNNSGMPVSSMTMGDANVPVIWGFPVQDLSMVLKPGLWPYFLFDVERAFAFSWNLNIFLFLASTFLLFMALARNNFWLSVAGSFFIFLSGAMQWWSYSLGGQMIYLNISFLSILYLLYSKNQKAIILSGFTFLYGSYGFITILYPAWQVPLGYLYAALLTGFILKKKNFSTIKEKLNLRTAVILAAIAALAFFLYHYYGLIDRTFELMMNTAYPGKRISLGGDLVDGKLFSEFFGMYLMDNRFPQKWLNICEASNFIMFFPVIFYCIGYNWIKTKKTDSLLLALSIYIIFLLVWLLIGFPAFLSKATLLSMSPVYRTLPVLGVANCILLVYYLGTTTFETKTKFSWLEAGILAITISLFLSIVSNSINNATNDFFNSDQVRIVLFLFTAVYLLVRFSFIKYVTPILLIILLAINISNIKIHPITSGLSTVLKNPVVKLTEPIKKQEPDARWAVFGNQMLTNLLKVNGINVFNGVKAVPILNDMKVLDPSGKNDSIYNRYAHIVLQTYIDGKDSVNFRLNENKVVNDNYTISMDPCSPKLKELGVKYFMFTYLPKEAEIRCMAPVKDTFGIYIFKRKDE